MAKSVLGRSETMRFELDLGNRFQNFAPSYRDPGTLAGLGPWARRLVLADDFRRASVTCPDETTEDTLDVAAGLGGPMGSRLQLAATQRFAGFDLASTLEGDVPFLTPCLGQRFSTGRTGLALTYESRDRARTASPSEGTVSSTRAPSTASPLPSAFASSASSISATSGPPTSPVPRLRYDEGAERPGRIFVTLELRFWRREIVRRFARIPR